MQIELTSAYVGYGVGSLGQDADEIHMLVNLLRTEFNATVNFPASHGEVQIAFSRDHGG